MKKIFSVITVMTVTILSNAQSLDFNAIGRLEAQHCPGENGISAGQSALYTFIDGTIAPGVSFSLSNHWLSSEPKYLFSHCANSWSNDFIDWATISYESGSFKISAGKDLITLGMMEMEPYDVDTYWQLNSMIWNEYALYQWGVKASWAIDENNTLALHVTNSPYETGKYFENGMFAWNLGWRGSIQGISTNWSINRFGKFNEKGNKSSDWFVFLGNSYDFGAFVMSADLYLKNFRSFIPSVSLKGTIAEFLDLTVKGGLYGGEGFYVGAVAEARPFKGLKNLSFFLCSSYQGYYDDGFSGCLGVKYNIFKSWPKQ